jgi:hypothetical protein
MLESAHSCHKGPCLLLAFWQAARIRGIKLFISVPSYHVLQRRSHHPRARTFRKNGRALPPNFLIEVEVTDFSSVLRTVATVTTGDGAWETIDLTQQGFEYRT